MLGVLKLRGRSALSAFRLEKLRRALASVLPQVRISAEYWHFVQIQRALQGTEQERLERVLTYGPRAGEVEEGGELLLVVPRLGTISPWSSKATDIARHCGLAAIERIERGIAFWVHGTGDKGLTAQQRAALLPHIHDRMTETVLGDFDAAAQLFHRVEPQPLASVNLGDDAFAALRKANADMGLALSDDEIQYLADSYARAGRNPTDVELMMFAQANSEHCRHKIFNADWVIDGERQPHSLFGMIRTTHAKNPQGTIVAYADNAAVMEGKRIERFYPGEGGAYRYVEDDTHILMKVETHNHPTAISPFPGASTGAGGEIRDEGATGRGARPKAGLTGYTVSNLRIPGSVRAWEREDAGRPRRIASALQIMLEGPIGGASFNNEFGRPNLAGYFRSYEQRVSGEVRGYHKPIMIAGGIGNISARHAFKEPLPAGTLLIQLGGPGMLIGLGGGAASSMDTGTNQEDLDFDSVQRGNAEIERRAQEVIDRCWALGERNPILSIHDVGAGGLSNALPELVHGASRGGRFDLRKVPSEEPGMSPVQIWCNEAQERYVLAIAPDQLPLFTQICERERAPFAVVGTATAEEHLVVEDPVFENKPVDMDLGVLFGKPPKMLRNVTRAPRKLEPLDIAAVDLRDAAYRVLRLPTVADKTFLISIGDRTVGGVTARDQFVGPWQVPVADVAVTTMGLNTYSGEAMAMGERTPLALISPEASGRLAIGEAITNIAAARIADIAKIKLSANWMAAAGHPGEDAALYDTVRAVALELCPELGISIPVGKDSLSMKTTWEEAGERREVTAPLSLIISAFAPVVDARDTLTPQLRTDCGDTVLLLVDISEGRSRLGASALAQVYGQLGDLAPDLDDAETLASFFSVMQDPDVRSRILAYHDRSDGGLFAAVCEMMFAGRAGATLQLEAWPHACPPARLLFNEELGALLQVKRSDADAVRDAFESAGVPCRAIGVVTTDGMLRVRNGEEELLCERRVDLHRAWSETTNELQRLRDHPECAQQEYDRILDEADPGLHAELTFDANEDVAAPYIARGVRPKVAILREQGINGQIEMAAAFDRAGFDAVDVHMTDIIAGRVTLDAYEGFAAGGGFSYGDVLGAGEGWAKSILFNGRARDEFAAFFERKNTFALGACNGCQMMSNLHELIPGAETWPHFVRNKSEQFEARFVMVEVLPSPSIFFGGMAGSRIPISIAHGEGYAEFPDAAALERVQPLVAVRYVDNYGGATTAYPYNPSCSPQGITGVTTPDGRFSILMPHPERVYRTIQNSWHPAEWGEDAPWMRMFRNARRWVG